MQETVEIEAPVVDQRDRHVRAHAEQHRQPEGLLAVGHVIGQPAGKSWRIDPTEKGDALVQVEIVRTLKDEAQVKTEEPKDE